MALRDLFKSEKQRQKDRERERRKAFRHARRAADEVKGRLDAIKAESRKLWAEAKEHTLEGREAAAMRAITRYRAAELLVAKTEQKRWVFEQMLLQLDSARTDQAFGDALAAVDKVIGIDPEKVDNVIEAIDEKLGEQAESDRVWKEAYAREMQGAAGALEEVVPSIDDLKKQLESEILAQPGRASDAEHSAALEQAKERLKRLTDQDGK